MDARKSIIKATKFMLALIAGLFLIFILILFNPIAIISNNYKMSKLRNEVLENKYPNSKLIMQESHQGLLHCCSNHCDFLVQVIYSTNDDFSKVKEHYDKIEFSPVIKSEPPVLKEVIDLSGNLLTQQRSILSDIHSKINEVIFNTGYDSEIKHFENKTIYLVNVFDQFHEGFGMNDIRCH